MFCNCNLWIFDLIKLAEFEEQNDSSVAVSKIFSVYKHNNFYR